MFAIRAPVNVKFAVDWIFCDQQSLTVCDVFSARM